MYTQLRQEQLKIDPGAFRGFLRAAGAPGEARTKVAGHAAMGANRPPISTRLCPLVLV